MSRSTSSNLLLCLLVLLSLLSLAAAQNSTVGATNGTSPTTSQLPSGSADGDDPSSGANTVTSKAALFGALIAAAVFAI